MISIFKNKNLTIYFPYLFYYPLFYNPLTIINAYYKGIIMFWVQLDPKINIWSI